jgi:S1-C subfamily serine protease
VPGDLLDVLLVVAAVLFAVSGYRQGFVVGVLSFVGFLGGGVLGAKVAPEVAASQFFSQFPRAVVGLGVVFLAATVGQVVATLVGGAVRRQLTWRPAREVDALGGAVVSVVSLLLVSWLVGRAVASSPYPDLASQVRRSVVIGTVDALLPDAARRFFDSFRDLVDERGFPEVFEDLRPTEVRDVPAPDPALAASDLVRRAEASVLKVTGVAESCRRSVEGTGFVYAPERVMTNAHVVAGVDEPVVELPGGEELEATVVLYDPQTDVAVLAVPGLEQPLLGFAGAPAEEGADAVVVGYPLDGPYRADAARVRGRIDARGPDIYGASTVVRDVYALRGTVRPGNSGGPLLAPDGSVVGVIFAAAADDPQVGYALTVPEVADEAEAGLAATASVDTQGCA